MLSFKWTKVNVVINCKLNLRYSLIVLLKINSLANSQIEFEECLTLVLDSVTSWPSFEPTWPIFLLNLDIMKKYIPSFNKICLILWNLQYEPKSMIWPSDLEFRPWWPIFKSVMKMIKINNVLSVRKYTFCQILQDIRWSYNTAMIG